MFVVNLAEYDQVLFEDGTQNRLQESLMLFDFLVNAQWFTQSKFILLFSNIIQFRKKLQRQPLVDSTRGLHSSTKDV
jgi:hypothetical protein